MSHHQEVNRGLWSVLAAEYVEPARESWAGPEPYWGIWRIPEAARLLRPGGRLVFMTGSPLMILCSGPIPRRRPSARTAAVRDAAGRVA